MSIIKKLLFGSGATSVRPAEEITELIKNGAFILDVRTKIEARKAYCSRGDEYPPIETQASLD